MIVLPADPTLPFYDFETELDGATYRIELKWNFRDEAWFFTLADLDNNILLASRRVVVNMPLRSRFFAPGLPPGEFIAIDTTDKDIDPGLRDLGDRVLLCYVEQGDT